MPLREPPIQQPAFNPNSQIFTQHWILWFGSIVSELANGIILKITDTPSGGVINPDDELIIFDISIATIAVLPDPAIYTGLSLRIVNKYSSTANLTFSENINGSSSYTLTPANAITIVSDGTEYLIY